MIDVLRKTLDLLRPDPLGRWLLLIVLAAVVSLTEVLGATVIFALLGLAAAPDGGMSLPIVGDVRRLLPATDETTMLVTLAVAAGVYFVLRAVLVMVQAYAQARISHNAGTRIATRLFRGYLAMPYEFHLQRNSSEAIRNAFQTVKLIVTRVLAPLAQLVAEVLLVAMLTVFLLLVEPMATLLAGLVMSIAVWVLLRIVQPRLKRLGQDAHRESKQGLQVMQQSLQGVREIRLLGRERYFVRQFEVSRQEYARSSYLSSAASELPRMVIETTLVTFILTYLAVTVVTSGTMGDTIASLGIMAYVGFRLQPSLQKVVVAANNLRYATASIDDVARERELLASSWAGGDADTGEELEPFGDRVRIEHLSFTYEGSPQPALTIDELEFREGESIGICGPTGGGKSTFIDLLTGLLVPQEGRVLVDGVDIHTHLRSWHRQLGVVSQTVFLLDDSLRRNIALGIADDRIDEEALADAIRLAKLDDLVASLPAGLDTVVGERGARLSGGQRQRVAIARALYRRPRIIVLDEGTSALDGVTEAEFMQGLDDLKGSHTLVMVAHRLSTVRRCDRIHVVENGRIVDSGDYDGLVARNPTFRAMAG